MFAKRAHHRLPRPVGLPPRYLRASATTFDEGKLEAIAPPAGGTVAFDPTPVSAATLALALARQLACPCATPRAFRLHAPRALYPQRLVRWRWQDRSPASARRHAPSVTCCARPGGAWRY